MKNKISTSDIPLVNPNEDLLGFASFSEQLAKALLRVKNPFGLVVSINGPWGSGKSSIINFIKYYLSKEDENKPILINFNPWHFSGQDNLIREFFNDLLGNLTKHHELKQKLKNDLAELAGILGRVPLPYFNIGGFFENKLKEHTPIDKLRGNVSKTLEDQNQRIIVIVDDIDRLTSEEIRQLFKLIKSVANFPNIIYLLAFDYDVVCGALTTEQNLAGSIYLEKIIQMPFHIPLADREALRQLFFSNLDLIIKKTSDHYLDKERWNQVYNLFIEKELTTPRTIVRLINTLGITYPPVENEVNVVDFVSLEVLRISYPEVYEIVRTNEWFFTMDQRHIGFLQEINTDSVKEFHEKWLSNLNESSLVRVKICIQILFPKVADALNSEKPRDEHRDWRRILRVCCPECFQTYFRLYLPTGSISNVQFQEFFSQLNNETYVRNCLLELIKKIKSDGTSVAKDYLDRLVDYIDVIPVEHFSSLIFVLHDIGDQLERIEDEGQHFYSVSNNLRISWIVYHSLKRIDEENRFEIYKRCFEHANSIYTIADRFDRINDEHDEDKKRRNYSDSEPSISKNHLINLKEIMDKRLTLAINDYSFLDAPHIARILSIWNKFGHKDEIFKITNSILETQEQFLKFMKGFVTYTRSTGENENIANIKMRVKPSWFTEFVDSKKVYEKSISILQSNKILEDYEKILKQFITEFEAESQGKYFD